MGENVSKLEKSGDLQVIEPVISTNRRLFETESKSEEKILDTAGSNTESITASIPKTVSSPTPPLPQAIGVGSQSHALRSGVRNSIRKKQNSNKTIASSTSDRSRNSSSQEYLSNRPS